MNRRALSFFLLAASAIAAVAQARGPVQARGGGADLSSLGFGDRSAYEIRGEWQFWWNALVDPDSIARGDAPAVSGMAAMPGYWNESALFGERLPAIGAATYRLSLALPDRGVYGLYLDRMFSSFRLYVNGEELASAGIVSLDPRLMEPEFRPQAVYFRPKEGRADLVLQIANRDYRRGGQGQALLIGSARAVGGLRARRTMAELFLSGAIVMIGLYNLSLFLFRAKYRSPLWFGLFCLVVAARVLATGSTALSTLVRGFPWELLVKLELGVFYLGAALFGLFIMSLYPREVTLRGFSPVLAAYALFTVLALATPVSFFNTLALPMQLAAAAGLAYILAGLILALARGSPDAAFMLAGFAVFALTALNDLLYARGAIGTAYLVPAGLFVFILSQAVALARIFSRSLSRAEYLSASLARTNRSLERFVPTESLSFLGRENIVDLQLGDHALRDITILFSGIRPSSSISESLTPRESIAFLNSYLERVGPVIRSHGGFIDAYGRGAIMALFPDSPSGAIESAIAIRRAIRPCNASRAGAGLPPVQVGIGLHAGPAMLGIIGETMRLESAVISDTVNLASRIENLTRFYEADALVSGALVRAVRSGGACPFSFRLVDRLTVKGKSEPCEIHELLDARRPEELAAFLESRDAFERAVELFHAGRADEAKAAFRSISEANPLDQVARMYVSRRIDGRGPGGGRDHAGP